MNNMNTHDAWENIHKNKEWGGYPSEHIVRFIARNYYKVGNRGKIRILDFGCGTGANTWYLAREGFDTYAFDISETAVERLKDRMSYENLGVKSEVADGLKLDYDTAFFDAVIDNVSIQSNRIEDINEMYSKVYDILKTNGKFITVVFGKETTGYGTGVRLEDGTYECLETGPLQKVGCRHFFDKSELGVLLKNIGFSNIVIEKAYYTDNGNVVQQWIAKCDKTMNSCSEVK